MPDRVTANLPARDFGETAAFYAPLGFTETFRSEGWMILARGPLEIEFFPHPGLNPSESWFSASIRVDDVDALHAAWSSLGLPESGIPRLTSPKDEPWGRRAFVLIDPNGSLFRCMAGRYAPVPDAPFPAFHTREGKRTGRPSLRGNLGRRLATLPGSTH
jgi:hypothetical protein